MKNIYDITMYYFCETRLHYEAMDGFQLTMKITVPVNSWQSSCLCFPGMLSNEMVSQTQVPHNLMGVYSRMSLRVTDGHTRS